MPWLRQLIFGSVISFRPCVEVPVPTGYGPANSTIAVGQYLRRSYCENTHAACHGAIVSGVEAIQGWTPALVAAALEYVFLLTYFTLHHTTPPTTQHLTLSLFFPLTCLVAIPPGLRSMVYKNLEPTSSRMAPTPSRWRLITERVTSTTPSMRTTQTKT